MSVREVTRSERLYRMLLRAYPRGFRGEYEEEMVRLFLDQLAERSRGGRTTDTVTLWLRSVGDVAWNAAGEHLRGEARVVKRVDAGSAALTVSAGHTVPIRRAFAIASLPFILILLGPFMASEVFAPIYSNPPEVLGLPAGIVILFLVATWASIAFVAIRVARSSATIMLALLIFTVPAIVAIIALPLVILAVLNLNV